MSSGTTGETFAATIQRPSDETLKKIDFVIQGVENGLFKDLSKKIDFHQKLKGEDPTQFIQSLLAVVENQNRRIAELELAANEEKQQRFNAEAKLVEIEAKVCNYNSDMRGIANALLQIQYPDPLGQNFNLTIDEVSAQNFVDGYKQKY